MESSRPSSDKGDQDLGWKRRSLKNSNAGCLRLAGFRKGHQLVEHGNGRGMESEPERIGKTRVNTGRYRVHKGGFGSQEMRTEMIRYVNQWRSWKGTGTELGDRLEAARLPWVVSCKCTILYESIVSVNAITHRCLCICTKSNLRKNRTRELGVFFHCWIKSRGMQINESSLVVVKIIRNNKMTDNRFKWT